MKTADGRSKVVEVRSSTVSSASVTDVGTLEDMLGRAVRVVAGASSTARAWQAVLGPARRIVLKFNVVGERVIGTTQPLARALLSGLQEAGYDSSSIALVEAPERLARRWALREPARGWGSPVNVGRGREPLAAYLYEADAVINVPFLKTHQIAGMSGCLKNLSHALIRHPARYHDNGCSPYVGQVVGSQEVSSRLRLNVMNALRVVVKNGPDAREQDIVEYGGLLVGFDPVAVDTVGLELLAVERRRLGLPGPLPVRYLASAGKAGVGRWRPGQLERLTT